MRSSAGAHEWVCITFEDPLGGKRGPDAATPGGNGLSTTDRDQISGRELLEYQNNRGNRKRRFWGKRRISESGREKSSEGSRRRNVEEPWKKKKPGEESRGQKESRDYV